MPVANLLPDIVCLLFCLQLNELNHLVDLTRRALLSLKSVRRNGAQTRKQARKQITPHLPRALPPRQTQQAAHALHSTTASRRCQTKSPSHGTHLSVAEYRVGAEPCTGSATTPAPTTTACGNLASTLQLSPSAGTAASSRHASQFAAKGVICRHSSSPRCQTRPRCDDGGGENRTHTESHIIPCYR